MSSAFIDNKFNIFEKYLRDNYKDTTVNSSLYVGISSAEKQAFMVYFLKNLLNHLNELRTEAEPYEGEDPGITPVKGKRSSVPIPKGGVYSIKSGKLPELNLKNMVDERLPQAIKDFLSSVDINGNMISDLINADNKNGELTLDDLNSITTEYKSSTVNKPLWEEFDIRNYLHESEAVFIFDRIRTMIRRVHFDIVLPLCRNYQTSDGSSEITVKNGIISVVSQGSGIPDFFREYFMNGEAVELRTGSISTSDIVSAIQAGSIPGLECGFIYENSGYGTIILTLPLTVYGTNIYKLVMTGSGDSIVPKE